MPHFVLTLSCCDRTGIVAGVAGVIADAGGNIEESAQFGDRESGQFFMRVRFDLAVAQKAAFIDAFAQVADRFAMDWRLRNFDRPMRAVILVSRFDHCLADLVYRTQIGALKMDIRAIISNHGDARYLAERAGVAFHHWPVTPHTKADQEARLLELVEEEQIELVILARYMQILSDELTQKLAGRAINIHHSFLPSFKGARPYAQAYQRGVKLIGATAHYVTGDLDEGPIIEQETERVDHSYDGSALVAAGRDIEARVLARAVRYHIENRVLINGTRTVVFR